MSTIAYHPDELVPFVAAILLRDAPHQRDLYGAGPERIGEYIEGTGCLDGVNAFLSANARAFATYYRESTLTLEWTAHQTKAVAKLVQVGGLSVEVLSTALRGMGLLRSNLDDCATIEALEFLLRVNTALCWLVARLDVRTMADR